jgi:RNA polymerase sigma-70 factor (ECF subfamily)
MSHGFETEMGGAGKSFRSTVWTDVLRVRDGAVHGARAALERLIEIYWKPVYFQIRRWGHDVEDAKDLTQQYFTLFMERDAIRSVDPAKGRFRAFVRASLAHFLSDERDRRRAKKRTLPSDFARAERQYHEDATFDRDWATAVLERAFLRLRSQAPREARIVEAQRSGEARYRELADEMAMTEVNVKVLAHRGREKLRALILDELRQTVSRPGDEDEELAALFEAFSL